MGVQLRVAIDFRAIAWFACGEYTHTHGRIDRATKVGKEKIKREN